MDNKRPSSASDLELAEWIIDLHDKEGLGFRRISMKLSSDNLKISKDRAFRLYHKYKRSLSPEKRDFEEKLRSLSRRLKRAENRVKCAKAKHDMQKRIAVSMLQEADLSFAMRRRTFKNKRILHDFAKKVLPVTSPAIWLKLTDFCTAWKIDLTTAIQEAIGDQASYEETRMECKKEGRDYLLHEHLSTAFDDWVLQNEPMEEGDKDSRDSEEETITVEFADY